MKYTVTLSGDRTLLVEAENFGAAGNGLVVFNDGCSAPVAAVQAHDIVRITTDAVTVQEEAK